jgi:hypothetical protein
MAILENADVQAFVDETKFEVTAIPDGLEANAVSLIFGILRKKFDTTLWVDALTTPHNVKVALALMVCSWWYTGQVGADAVSADAFARDLRDQAYFIAHSLNDGQMELL